MLEKLWHLQIEQYSCEGPFVTPEYVELYSSIGLCAANQWIFFIRVYSQKDQILQHAMFSEISKLNLFFHFSILKDFSAAFISLSGRGADNACTTVNLTQMSMIYMCDQ